MQKKQISNQNLSELSDRQVIDIVHSKGARRVDETSKPIIVTNRPMVKDSMLTQSANESAHSHAHVAHEMVVTPPESSVASESEVAAASNASSGRIDMPSAEDYADSKQTVASDTEGSSTPGSAETDDSSELDALIEQKTYFLPINTALHRRSRRVAIVGTVCIILLLAAWLDIALDAGIIDIPALHAVTNFFGLI